VKVKFTDEHRYPHGYRKAQDTDVRKTFARVREQQAKNEAEVKAKVTPMKAKAR